jgi:hypothetical protein
MAKALMRRILRSPFIIASIYLSLIPLFAAIYALIWPELLQTTIEDDPTTDAIRQSAVFALGRVADDVMRAVPGMLDQGSGTYVRLPDDNDTYVEIVFKSHNEPLAETRPTAVISIRESPDGFYTDKGPIALRARITMRSPELATNLAQALARQTEGPFSLAGVRGNELFGELTLTGQILLILQRDLAVKRGRPAPISGAFIRYVYFSVVTITTVGYGDIVPLTDRARLIVGLEALLGIVFAGLFINAVGLRSAV